MKTYYCNKDSIQLPEELAAQTDLFYRGLGEGAEEEFIRKGIQTPQHGDFSVGKGVFFSDKLETAAGFSKGRILVTSLDRLATKDMLDTRDIQTYDKMNEEFQRKNKPYTQWDVHLAILEHDTLSTADENCCTIYTARREISEKDLIAEIILN